MARSNESAGVPEVFRALANLKAVGRAPRRGLLQVFVRPITSELRQLVRDVHADIELGVSVATGVMPVTEDELLRYVVTALRTRVAHVNRERFPIRVQDPWALPHVFNYMASAIGRLELEMMTVVPEWTDEANEFILTLDEHVRITQQLRSLKFRGYDFARALSSEREGHLMVMTLIHVVDEWVGHQIFTLPDAIVAAAVGIEPQANTDFTESHPLYAPTYRVEDIEVIRYLPRLADVRVNRGAAAS